MANVRDWVTETSHQSTETNEQRKGEADEMKKEGYWCVVCGRFLSADDTGVIVHDDVPHPEAMTFNEEDVLQ